jgi:hypothetical protein
MKRSEEAVADILPLKPQIRLTRTQRKILDTRNAIYFQPQPDGDDMAFSARELVQATLPHQTPRGNPPVWYRKDGNYTLSIRPGYKTNPKTGEYGCIGYPYGNIPRLVLFWITTEALRTGTRRLELGGSLAGFMRELGLDPDHGGKWSPRARLHDQIERLFNASISFEYAADGHRQWLNMEVTSEGETWWDFKQPHQDNLFTSWVELGEKFYQAITSHPVPLDMRTLQTLKSSSMALDLYAWLAYRSHRVNQNKKQAFIAWKQMHQQFGASYNDPKDFKRRAKDALRKVVAVYHHLKVEEVRGGIRISPGFPLITAR